MKVVRLIFIGLIILAYSCNNKEKQIDKSTDLGRKSAEEFAQIFTNENKKYLLNSENIEELYGYSSKMYTHIGNPLSTQDTNRLSFAVELLNRILVLDDDYLNAYRTKFSILCTIDRFDDALLVLKSLYKKEESYYTLMNQGFVYEKLMKSDSSDLYFKKALELLNHEIDNNPSIKMKVNRAILIALVYGKEGGLKEISNVIEETNNDYAKSVKQEVLINFDKKEYIKDNFFPKSERLN